MDDPSGEARRTSQCERPSPRSRGAPARPKRRYPPASALPAAPRPASPQASSSPPKRMLISGSMTLAAAGKGRIGRRRVTQRDLVSPLQHLTQRVAAPDLTQRVAAPARPPPIYPTSTPTDPAIEHTRYLSICEAGLRGITSAERAPPDVPSEGAPPKKPDGAMRQQPTDAFGAVALTGQLHDANSASWAHRRRGRALSSQTTG